MNNLVVIWDLQTNNLPEQKFKVFYNNIGVIICFQNPVNLAKKEVISILKVLQYFIIIVHKCSSVALLQNIKMWCDYDIMITWPDLGLAPYLIVLLLAVADEGGNLIVIFCRQEPEVGAPPAPGLQNLNIEVIHSYSEPSFTLPSVLSSCGFVAIDAISKDHFQEINKTNLNHELSYNCYVMLMLNAQPSKDKWIAAENLQSNNLHWAAAKIVYYWKTLKEGPFNGN